MSIPDLMYDAAVANARLVAGVADWFLSFIYPEPDHFTAADMLADVEAEREVAEPQ